MSDDQTAGASKAPSEASQAEAAGPTIPSPPAPTPYDSSRLSPRTRAHSVTSSLDSSHASSFSAWVAESPSCSSHTRPSLDFPAATLKPTHQVDGFLVDVPGSGQWAVSWAELVDLLLSPQTHETLAPRSVIAELAQCAYNHFSRSNSRLNTLQPMRPATAVSSLGADLHGLSVAAEPTAGDPPFPIHPAQRGFHFQDPSGRGGNGWHDPQTVAPLQTVGSYFLAPINTELPVPPPQFTTTQPTPTSSSTTIPQRATMRGAGRSSTRSGSPSRPSSVRSESAVSTRLHARQASAPYPRPAYLHASSFDELSGSGMSAGEYDDEPGTALPSDLNSFRHNGSKSGKRGPLRPLNRETETYLWHPRKGTLSRIPPGVDVDELASYQIGGGEVLVFPPGSYQKLIVDDLEILPCDSRQRVNEWLRAQTCVEGCAFRFEGKRPSVIRAHVVHCKNRACALKVDPLKRLCQLQLDAHQLDSRLRLNHKVPTPPLLRRPLPTQTSGGEDHSDSRSIISFESVDSLGYSASSSQGSIYEHRDGQMYDGEDQRWDSQYASTKAEDFNESSAASVLSAGFSSLHGPDGAVTGGTATASEPWLYSYGLSVPNTSSASSASTTSPNQQHEQHEQRPSMSTRSSSMRAATSIDSKPSSFLEM